MRFDMRGPPAGDVGGQQGDNQEEAGHPCQGHRLERRGLEQLRAHGPSRGERPRGAKQHANRHDRHGVRDDVPDDLTAVGTERQPDGDFTPAQAHDIRDEALEADACQEQRPGTEDGEER